MTVTRVGPAEIPRVHTLMRELARSEGNEAAFTATTDDLHGLLFDEPVRMLGWVAHDPDGVVGAALGTPTVVAVSCRPVLRLLNLVVDDAHRNSGVGTALLRAVADHAQGRFDTVELSVRAQNAGAQAFYRAVGGTPMPEWQPWRVPADALERLRTP